MKILKFIVVLILMKALPLNSTGQDSLYFDIYDKISNYNLSNIFCPDSIEDDASEKFEMTDPLGFIDTNYQRFQVHFLSIIKSKSDPYKYNISGKTKVKENICSFTGTITVVAATIEESAFINDIGLPGYQQGYITGLVQINEDRNQAASGFIKGTLSTNFIIDTNGVMKYDAIFLVADGFYNNQFVGEWTSYRTGKTKKCNWGDFRIPDCGDLDVGTGEFYPNEKYLDNGWRSYYDYSTGSEEDPKRKEAEKKEYQWWRLR
jgi:hypothetical protein